LTTRYAARSRQLNGNPLGRKAVPKVNPSMPFTNPLADFEPLGPDSRVAEVTLANWATLTVDPSGSTLPWFRFQYEVASAINRQRPPDHPTYRAEYLYTLCKPRASQHYRPIYDTPFRVQTGRQAQAWYERMSTCYDFFYALGADWDQTFSQASIATARDNLANSIPVQATERGAYYQLVAAMQQLSDRQKHVIHLLTEEMLALRSRRFGIHALGTH
jgi:hypothetical protein